MTEREALIVLSAYVPFGPRRLKLLGNYYGSFKKALESSSTKLLALGISEKLVFGFEEHKKQFNLQNYLKAIERYRISLLVPGDKNYPLNLTEIDDSPAPLYVKGKVLAQDRLSVAIVGTRKPTSYGREVTANFSSWLAQLGITIVSGLARGIDTVAHKSAISVGGRTIAVLGGGLDRIYPSENVGLARKIVSGFGAIVSEFPLGLPPLRHNFPQRNRIVSGLSKAVVVVEGTMKSGTLHTVSSAVNQNREVFAVPGPITSKVSEAPNYLIKNGSTPAVTPQDIVEFLGIDSAKEKVSFLASLPERENEKAIFSLLDSGELHMDEIVRKLNMQTSKVSATLTIMEMKGLVKNIGEGVYRKA